MVSGKILKQTGRKQQDGDEQRGGGDDRPFYDTRSSRASTTRDDRRRPSRDDRRRPSRDDRRRGRAGTTMTRDEPGLPNQDFNSILSLFAVLWERIRQSCIRINKCKLVICD